MSATVFDTHFLVEDMTELTKSDNHQTVAPLNLIQEQIRCTFFANVAGRKVSIFAPFQNCLNAGMKIAADHFQILMKEVTRYCGICYTAGASLLGMPVGVIVKHNDSLVLLRNPVHLKTTNSTKGMIARMTSDSLCFEDLNIDPIAHWQSIIEPVQEQPYAYC